MIQKIGRWYKIGGANLLLAACGWMPRYRAAAADALYRLGWEKRPASKPVLPPVEIPATRVAEAIPDPVPVIVREQDAADGNVTALELLVISQFVALRRPLRIFEIGTFDGRTALNMAANMPEGGQVFTLDLPPEGLANTVHQVARGDIHYITKSESGARFKRSAYAGKIQQLLGDSAAFDYGPYWGTMDLVFVDGSHSYDYVKKDTETALKLLKPEGGLILWHDYGSPHWPDLTRAMNDLYREEPRFKTMRRIEGTVIVMWEKTVKGCPA